MRQYKLNSFLSRGVDSAPQTTVEDVRSRLNAKTLDDPKGDKRSMDRIGKADPSVRKVYSPPKLTKYGTVLQMTAAGTSGPVESEMSTERGPGGGSRP